MNLSTITKSYSMTSGPPTSRLEPVSFRNTSSRLVARIVDPALKDKLALEPTANPVSLAAVAEGCRGAAELEDATPPCCRTKKRVSLG